MFLFYFRLTHATDRPTFQCNHCPKICNRLYDLNSHIQKQHNNNPGGGETKTFLCKVCSESFPDRQNLTFHLAKEHGFKCDICDKDFTTKYGLKYHVEVVHEGKSRFVCKTCNAGFSNKSTWTKHIRTQHAGVFVTDGNGEEFEFDLELKFDDNELFKNIGEANGVGGQAKFNCAMCPKWFVLEGDLDFHVIDEHKCQECGMEFIEQDDLRNHVQYNHGSDPLS